MEYTIEELKAIADCPVTYEEGTHCRAMGCAAFDKNCGSQKLAKYILKLIEEV